MLVIRLLRKGRKNQPFFKIVVTDKKNAPRGGRFVEEVGFWNPKTKEKTLNGDRIKRWISMGAKPSETVYNLLIVGKIIEGKKTAVHKKSRPEAHRPLDDKKKPAEGGTAPVAEAKKEEKPAEAVAQ